MDRDEYCQVDGNMAYSIAIGLTNSTQGGFADEAFARFIDFIFIRGDGSYRR
jgi:hypothetical protein